VTDAVRRRLPLLGILVLAAALRFYGVHNPILDHPGWRQGDEAAIARNFAQLENDIGRPQTDYDGPPPNYVELELQIVPYLAAQAYRAFGIHEIFARMIVIAFSLGTVVLLYLFGRDVFSPRAGLLAALAFAVAPGAVYYGRTFTPDTVMLFFMTGTLYWWWRFCDQRERGDFAWAVVFGALAWLAKPVALIAFVPIVALELSRQSWRGALKDGYLYAYAALTLIPSFFYFRHVHAIAEWHWASGITGLHVLPALRTALTSAHGLLAALQGMLALLRMLASTVLGPVLFATFLGAWFALPRDGRERDRQIFFGAWLVAFAVYVFTVVNVERVDYYLLPVLPLAVLMTGGALDNLATLIALRPRWTTAAALAAALFVVTYASMLEIHAYYTWSRPVYAAASELDRVLPRGALVVMGHYDPSVLYVIGRKGWEEDPLLWTVHDMQSAQRKGAAYFVAVELPRLRANKPLYAYLQRFARVPVSSGWRVYDMRRPAPSGNG
jgi:hypothetical protein